MSFGCVLRPGRPKEAPQAERLDRAREAPRTQSEKVLETTLAPAHRQRQRVSRPAPDPSLGARDKKSRHGRGAEHEYAKVLALQRDPKQHRHGRTLRLARRPRFCREQRFKLDLERCQTHLVQAARLAEHHLRSGPGAPRPPPQSRPRSRTWPRPGPGTASAWRTPPRRSVRVRRQRHAS